MFQTFLPEILKEGQPKRRSGLLPSQMLRDFCHAGYIVADEPVDEAQIQPASLDLRLGPVAYRIRASFLPNAATVATRLAQLLERDEAYEVNLDCPAILERECIYLIPLMERLHLPATISGRANPKSSIGRLDVFTRLVTDYGTEFERVPAGYSGPLYVEVIPRTFSVRVQKGTRVNQLRLVRGAISHSDAALDRLHADEVLVCSPGGLPYEPSIAQGLRISVDIKGDENDPIIGYRTSRRSTSVIALDRRHHYDLTDFWEPIRRPRDTRLILDPDYFYILASLERIRIPPSYAAEMVAYDSCVGEFRVHYAGFFDPGFGYGDSQIRGTRAVLEVRAHGVPFFLEHGQAIGRLSFEPLLDKPEKVYGTSIGSAYQEQGVTLSKHFKLPRPSTRRRC